MVNFSWFSCEGRGGSMTEKRALNGGAIMMQIDQPGNSALAPESNVFFPAVPHGLISSQLSRDGSWTMTRGLLSWSNHLLKNSLHQVALLNVSWQQFIMWQDMEGDFEAQRVSSGGSWASFFFHRLIIKIYVYINCAASCDEVATSCNHISAAAKNTNLLM